MNWTEVHLGGNYRVVLNPRHPVVKRTVTAKVIEVHPSAGTATVAFEWWEAPPGADYVTSLLPGRDAVRVVRHKAVSLDQFICDEDDYESLREQQAAEQQQRQRDAARRARDARIPVLTKRRPWRGGPRLKAARR